MNHCKTCKRDLPEGKECPVCKNKAIQDEINDIAKEICFQINTTVKCNMDCANCEGNGKWKQYKICAKRLIEKIRRNYASKN